MKESNSVEQGQSNHSCETGLGSCCETNSFESSCRPIDLDRHRRLRNQQKMQQL